MANIDLVRDTTVAKLLNRLDKQNGLLEVMAADSLKTLQNDWAGLEQLAESGLFGMAYDIGTRFTDTWKDMANNTEYAYPLQLNHIGDVELEDGELLEARPILQAHYAHPFGVQFSHPRAITAAMFKVTSALTGGVKYYWHRVSDNQYIGFTCPTGGIAIGQWLNFQNGQIEIYSVLGNLENKVAATVGASGSGTSLGDAPVIPAGDYYFTFASGWGTHVVAGDAVSFTLPEDLQFGDKISGCEYAPDYAKTTWKIYPVTENGKTMGTAIPVGNSTAGTNLGVVNLNTRNVSGDYLLNSIQEVGYGWNRWMSSAVRQYLNSAAGVNAWWTAYDAFDVRPNELNTKAGWLSGWSEEFIDSLKAVKVVTYPNTVQDDKGGVTPDITYDKVFLPSLEEIYVNPQKAGEGEAHEYWKRKSGSQTPLAQYGTYPNMITYAVENHTSPQNVRLRSAYRGYANSTWYVYSSGSVNSYRYAYYAYRFSPLVVL